MKLEGVRGKIPGGGITLATLCSGLQSTDLLGSVDRKTHKLKPGPLFLTDFENSVHHAAERLESFFGLFAEALKDHWEAGNRRGGYLRTNQGISALLILLEDIHTQLPRLRLEGLFRDKPLSTFRKEMVSLCAPIVAQFQSMQPEQVDAFRRKRGEAGKQEAAELLAYWIHCERTEYNSRLVESYLSKPIATTEDDPWHMMKFIEWHLKKFIIAGLKKKHGPEESGYWHRGVPQSIRVSASTLREKDERRYEKEGYINFAHLRDILCDKGNWDIFKEVFQGDKQKSCRDNLSWLMELNKIRRIEVHIGKRGLDSFQQLKQEEIDLIKKRYRWVVDHIPGAKRPRLPSGSSR